MRPRRPIGSSKKAQFWQWAYDEIIKLQPMIGPGIATDRTTRGVFRRLVGNGGFGGNRRRPSVCELPKLGNVAFHFGLWYDSKGELHLWNTTRVEHSGKSWARFYNPYTARSVPEITYEHRAADRWENGQYTPAGFEWRNGVLVQVAEHPNLLGSYSECLTNADTEVSYGPRLLDKTFFKDTSNKIRLDIGQYVDLLIYPKKPNSGNFWNTYSPELPADFPLVYNASLDCYFYDVPFGWQGLPAEHSWYGPWPLPYMSYPP